MIRRGYWAELAWLFLPCLLLCHQLSWANEARWQDLMEIGKDAERSGDFHRAEQAYRSALELVDRGDDVLKDNRVVLTLIGLAWSYQKQQKFDQAEPHIERACNVVELSIKHNGPTLALCLYNLADIYKAQGKYAKAEPVLRRVLTIKEDYLGPGHPDLIPELSSLAEVHKVLGQYVQAEPLLRRALAIREKAYVSDQPLVAVGLNNLANILSNLGNYAEAESLYRRALTIYERTLGPDDPNFANALNGLATNYHEQGMLSQAEPLLRRALSIRERALGPEHLEVAGSLNNLGVLLREQGLHIEATPLFRRAVTIIENGLGPEHADVAIVLTHLGSSLSAQGMYDQAVPILLRALAVSEKAHGYEHPSHAVALNDLAMIGITHGLYNQAEWLFRRALEIYIRAFGPMHPEVARTLSNLGLLYREQGHYAEAESLYRQALTIYETVLGHESIYVSEVLINLAVLLGEQKQFGQAESLLRSAHAILEQALGPDHPRVGGSLGNLARLFQRQQKYPEALTFVRQASAIARKWRYSEEPSHFVQSGKSRSLLRPFRDHAQLTGIVYQTSERNQRSALLSEAFAAAQMSRSSSAADALAQMATRTASGSAPLARLIRNHQDAVARWRQLDRQLLEILGKPREQRSADAETQLRKILAATETEISRLDEELRRDFPEYRELTSPEPLDVAETQRLLAPDEALLTWLVLNDETLLFLVRKDQVELIRIEQGMVSLMARVKGLRLTTEFPPVGSLPPFPRDKAHELYQIVLGPVEKHLAGIKHLILVPDGPLQSLSFGLLQTAVTEKSTLPQDMPWLARRYVLTTLPAVSSLRALRRLAKSAPAREPFIGFGNPALKGDKVGTRGVQMAKLFSRGAVADSSAVSEFQPLPETAEELRRIAASLKAPANSIHLGKFATETKVKSSALAQYRVVAFATHGLLAGEFQGLAEPALVLTPPATGSEFDDGLLTASEVAELKLNADWVILSACNTAGPDGTPGADGFTGLTKAFFYSGARSLLVSHWAVESKSAAEITSRLFSETSKGVPKAEALRRAMLSLADQPKTSHPAYWAPFVVVGEGR